jgi:glycosyltransferase involved in cell wall biosynthesis
MSRPAGDIDVLAVVIPARNEQKLLPRCLSAMATAAAQLGRAGDHPAVRIIVVVDASDDQTVRIATSWPGVETLVSDAGRVGAARRRGVDHLIRSSGNVDLRRIWISTTDADSAVPSDWLSTMLLHARTGVDMVLGTIRPDPDELAAGLMAAWRLRHSVTDGHPHVHGANLGVRGDTYYRAGGFRATGAHEDVLLAAAVRLQGGRVLSTASSPVLTSARTAGRAEAGMARYLAELDATEAQREA